MEKYTSKTKRNECKNVGCKNPRQDGSSHCKECSDKFIHEYMASLGRKGGKMNTKENMDKARARSLEVRRANKIAKENELARNN